MFLQINWISIYFVTYLALKLSACFMFQNMIIKVTQCNETFVTTRFLTKKRSFTSVQSHMSFKIAIFCKSFFANFTFKWFSTEVCIHMNMESSTPLVSLPTDFTLERLLFCMDHLVSLQMPLRNKLLVTIFVITNKWPISSVWPNMNFEISVLK